MKIILRPSPRHILLPALSAMLIAVASTPSFALDFFGSGMGAAVNGQLGVSTHINNTPVYAPLGGDIDTRNHRTYVRDAQERTVRQRLNTGIYQDMNISPADIAPAAGAPHYIKPHPVYNMGAIQGGHSYND